MANASVDFNAYHLDHEYIRKLNVLLSPNNPLRRDVRSVAGLLGFANDEISYINNKPYPFVYFYDQWLKREGKNATLRKLQNALIETGRPDAAELIENSIQSIFDKDPKEVVKNEEQYFSTFQRSISCATLTGNDAKCFEYAQKRNNECENDGTENPHKLLPVRKKDVNDIPPDVFVVYFRENEQHERNVVRFVKKLRKEGIDATADMFMKNKGADRAFYMYSKLIESDFVFVVCSKTFIRYENYRPSENKDENGKEVSFIMKMILGEIYDAGGINAKYIPILFGHSTEADVPSILKCSTIYKMPYDLEGLKRRVLGIEKYKLAPLPSRRPILKPKVIGKENGLLKFIRR